MCSDAQKSDPLIGQAAMANANMAREAMAYYRERDAEQRPRQARMDDLAEKLAGSQMDTSNFNTQQAREQWGRYKEVGIPAEDAMYRDAAEYDNQANRDKLAAEAGTDVDVAVAQAADARRRTMARAGVNPADGRALASEQEIGTQGALAKATAMNGARSQARQMGVMLRKDAASAARGMPGTAAQTFGVAGAAGAGAQGAVAGAMGTANATAGMMNNGFNTAIAGNNSAGSILNQEYSNKLKAADSGGLGSAMAGLGALGSGLGAMGVVLSDKTAKENRQPVDGDAALEGISNTPVESWTYKDDSPAADGGQQHIGGMAQDMQKNLGDTVAPGGKTVDIISALGVNMAAIQALNKKVDRIAGQASKGVKV